MQSINFCGNSIFTIYLLHFHKQHKFTIFVCTSLGAESYSANLRFAAGKVKDTEWMENTEYYVAPEVRVLEMKMELLVVVSEEREYGQAIEI